MPFVQVHFLEGRSPEVKQQLISEITDAVRRTLGIPSERVRVMLYEISKVNTNGGKASQESDQNG